MHCLTHVALAAIALPLAVGIADASSDEAWAQFRTDVETVCRALVQQPGTVTVEVNDFGSEHYGAAIVTVVSGEADAERVICIYDKAARTAEVTAPFVEGD